MNKTLFFAAVIGGQLCDSARADSRVSIYGVLDQGVDYTSNAGGANTKTFNSGILQGSRLGFKGNEDLGDGLEAVFVLETGINGANGVIGRGAGGFDRQSYLGMRHRALGSITLGRQYDEVVEYVATYSATARGGLMFCTPGDNDNTCLSFRLNNSVKYASPEFGGLAFSGIYSFGETTGTTASRSAVSGGIRYKSGPLYVSAAFNRIHDPVNAVTDGNWGAGNVIFGKNAKTATVYRVDSASANYDFGKTTLGAVYSRTTLENGLGGQDVRLSNYQATVTCLLTPLLTTSLSYTRTNGKVSATGAMPKWNQGAAILNYSLSKRTDIYVEGSLQQAAGDATRAQIIPPYPASSGRRQAVARVGVRVVF